MRPIPTIAKKGVSSPLFNHQKRLKQIPNTYVMSDLIMQSEKKPKPSDLDIHQLYKKIYLWHQASKQKSQLPPRLRKKYLNLIRDLPAPEDASVADISFVCNEINDGLMTWSLNEKVEHESKMVDFSAKIIEKLGGRLQAHSIAAKSKLAWKYWPKMKLLEMLLQHFSAEELRQLYIQYRKEPTISKEAAKDFILRKLIEEIPITSLFGDPKVSSMLSMEFEQLRALFKAHLLSLDKPDLDKICDDLEQSELAKKYKSKSKLIDRLLQNIPLHRILDSNVLRRLLMRKPVLKREIKKLESAISTVDKDLQKLTEKEYEHFSHFVDIYEKLQRLLRQQQEELARFLRMKSSPDAMAFLEMFRKELVSLEKPLSPEKLCEIIEQVRSELQTDELSFTLKGLEIMLTLYFLNQIKTMQWQPDFQEFLHVIREEIPKIQILPNQAEIPALRERVIQRLGIDEATFDNLLIKAWKKGHVTLHVGAPIGRGEVKYLKYEQSQYFYVKLPLG